MTSNNDDTGLFIAVCIVFLIIVSSPLWFPMSIPEETTVIEDEQGVSVFIAVHPYFGHWVDYNGTVSIVVDGRNESGNCIDSWFLTSYRYECGTNYTVSVNGTIVATDWIALVGDFGTWKGASWWGYIGKPVEVCHINLTLYSEAEHQFLVGQEEPPTPHIEFYDAWVSDSRTNVGVSVVVGFKVRWNDTLEDIEWGLCAEVYDGTRYYQLSYYPDGWPLYYQLSYYPDGWSLMTSYDEVCKKNFTVVSVGYFGERYELNGDSVLFEQTVESPDVIWDRVIVRQIPSPEETTTTLPKEHPLVVCIAVGGGAVAIVVIALALLRRRGCMTR